MTDLINRADAIEAVCGVVIDEFDVSPTCGYEVAEKALSALPSADAVSRKVYEKRTQADERIIDSYRREFSEVASAEAVQGWIPCSERLPDKDELVLVTVWDGVSIAWRNIYGGWESAEDMYEKGDVTAWMPLPTPYKGGGSE